MATRPPFSFRTKRTPLGHHGDKSLKSIISEFHTTLIFHLKGIGLSLPNLLSNAVSRLFRSSPKRQLDETPTGDEEYRDWTNEPVVSGDWNPDAARTRIDRISRSLAICWSVFLAWIVLAQGFSTDHTALLLIPIQGSFHLETSEFIAVVTTTTATVFGFLVIVARHVFSGDSP